MRSRWLSLLALLACAVPLRADEPFALKVLYAGNPGKAKGTFIFTLDFRVIQERSTPGFGLRVAPGRTGRDIAQFIHSASSNRSIPFFLLHRSVPIH